MRRTVFVVMFSALALAAGARADDLDTRQRLAVFLDQQEQSGFSGFVLVTRGEEILVRRGYGLADRKRGIAPTAETVFDVGSIAKLVTATAVLQLEQAGALSTNATLGELLEAVPADKRGITPHQLLTHSSGLTQYHDTRGDFQKMSREQALSAILGAELESEPGSRCSYSNAGYTLLALIVERISGHDYVEYVTDEIFAPAGMKRTGFYRDPRWTPATTARGYRGRKSRGSPATYPGPYWALLGNGGLVTTADDLRRFVRALEDGTLLGAAALATMREPYMQFRDEVHYARGFRVRATPRGGLEMLHGGGQDFGFSAYLRRFDDDDVLIVVTANSTVDDRSPVVTLAEGLEKILFP